MRLLAARFKAPELSMRSLWGFPEVQLGAFLAPGGYLLAVLISYAKRNSNVHHPKVFVAPKKILCQTPNP